MTEIRALKKPTTPCFECEKRSIGCHAKCKAFSQYEQEKEKWASLIQKGRAESRGIVSGKWIR